MSTESFMQQFDDARSTIAAIKTVMDAAPAPHWTLVAPDGRAWVGTQQDVARVLFQNIDVTQLFKGTP